MMEQMTDYITGREVHLIGPEISRQNFEKFLVETRGYAKQDIQVNEPLTVQFQGEDYVSSIDLVVCIKDRAVMAVTCVAGSIGSYEREILGWGQAGEAISDSVRRDHGRQGCSDHEHVDRQDHRKGAVSGAVPGTDGRKPAQTSV